MNHLTLLLTQVRDASSYKERINAFSQLPQELQRTVLDSGKTISDGAKVILGSIAPARAAAQLLGNAA